MTMPVEVRLQTVLREVRPRSGFAVELLGALTQDAHLLSAVSDSTPRWRSRWVMAGALAGVVTATGAVYVAARRHHGGAA